MNSYVTHIHEGYRYKQVQSAIKKLRKAGFRWRTNYSGFCEDLGTKYVYTRPVSQARRYRRGVKRPYLAFYYKGDFEVIKGVLESEGLEISNNNYHYFYLLTQDSVV